MSRLLLGNVRYGLGLVAKRTLLVHFRFCKLVGTHRALAVEDRTFIDDELCRTNVALYHCLRQENEFFLSYQPSTDFSPDRNVLCRNISFDFAGGSHGYSFLSSDFTHNTSVHAYAPLAFKLAFNNGAGTNEVQIFCRVVL